MKALIEFLEKAERRWLMKLWRVSSPLKLTKTSYSFEAEGGCEDEAAKFIRATNLIAKEQNTYDQEEKEQKK